MLLVIDAIPGTSWKGNDYICLATPQLYGNDEKKISFDLG